MIDRKKLVLEGITKEAYTGMRAVWRDGTQNGAARPRARVIIEEYEGFLNFARIVEPLKFTGFGDLLREFIQTPLAFCVSVRVQGGWQKTYLSEIEGRLGNLVSYAIDGGFVYLHFSPLPRDTDNEIGFDVYNGGVVSSVIKMPAATRRAYTWKGSDNGMIDVGSIQGLWVPREDYSAVRIA